MNPWKTMDTAPKNNMWVDIWCYGERHCNMYRDMSQTAWAHMYWYAEDGSKRPLIDPEFWMPIPPNPEDPQS